MKIDELKQKYPHFIGIVDRLYALERLDEIVAIWLEGSIAQGYGDQFSDLDIWVAVHGASIKDALCLVENGIIDLIDRGTAVDMSFLSRGSYMELIHKSYFMTDNNPIKHRIELNVQNAERDIELVSGVDQFILLFDKKQNSIKTRPQKTLGTSTLKLKSDLKKIYQHQRMIIKIEIERDHYLEALAKYNSLLDAIVGFKRLKEGHVDKFNYGLKHIYRDLPANFVKKLEYFYVVDKGSILIKTDEILGWIKDLGEE